MTLIRFGDRGDRVRDLQRRLIRAGFPVGRSGADGIFGAATLAAVRRFQTRRRLSVDGIVGPRTWAALTGTKPAAAAAGATGKALARLAYDVVTGRYLGGVRPRYVFGGEENDLRRPSTWNRIDCSELIELCTGYLGHRIIDGSGNQFQACKNAGREISVAQAKRIPGALLFIHGRSSVTGRIQIFHDGVSLGDGRTAEARSANMIPNCGVWQAGDRFNRAGLAPGFRY